MRRVDDQTAIVELDRDRAVVATAPRLDRLIRLTGAAEDRLDLFQRHPRFDEREVFKSHFAGASRHHEAQKTDDQQAWESHGVP